MEHAIQVCMEGDNVEEMHAILKKHPTLMKTSGYDLICAVIDSERLEILSFLTNVYTATIKQCDSNGNSILMYAVKRNRIQSTRVLLERLPNEIYLKVNHNGENVLHVAASNQNTAMTIHNLLMNSARSYLLYINNKKPPIEIAASCGNVGFLFYANIRFPEKLLEYKRGGTTPLHIAVLHSQLEFARVLMYMHAFLFTIKDENEHTPFYLAMLNNDSPMMELLIHLYPHTTTAGSASPLQEAVAYGDCAIIDFVLRCDPDAFNVVNAQCGSVLLFARSATTVEHLLRIKPTLIYCKKEIGLTILHLAAEFNCYHVVPALLEARPELLDAQDKDGDTAIDLALEQNNIAFIEAVFKTNPKLDYNDKNGNTSLHMIVRTSQSTDLISQVYNHNPNNAYIQNNNNETPFHIFLRYRCHEFDSNVERFFQSVLEVGFLIEIYQEFNQDYKLANQVVEQCNDLSLFPELKSIVFEYLDLKTDTKKRKRN